MGKKIYKMRFLYRIMLYFFYYWFSFTVLLFLPLFIFGTGYVFMQIFNLSKHTDPDLSSGEKWFYLMIGVVVTLWAIWYLIRFVKKLFRKPLIIEGVIQKKERIDYDEGCGYFITIQDTEYELSERGFKLIPVKSKMKVWYSEKINEVLKVEKC